MISLVKLISEIKNISGVRAMVHLFKVGGVYNYISRWDGITGGPREYNQKVKIGDFRYNDHQIEGGRYDGWMKIANSPEEANIIDIGIWFEPDQLVSGTGTIRVYPKLSIDDPKNAAFKEFWQLNFGKKITEIKNTGRIESNEDLARKLENDPSLRRLFINAFIETIWPKTSQYRPEEDNLENVVRKGWVNGKIEKDEAGVFRIDDGEDDYLYFLLSEKAIKTLASEDRAYDLWNSSMKFLNTTIYVAYY